MKLYEALKLSKDGFDICDNIFDSGVYYPKVKAKNNDAYNNLLLYFAKNIEVVNFDSSFYTSCKITEFIESKRKEFDEFMNLYNRNTYQPQNYDYISSDDEEFYDLYIKTFESLVTGHYAESNYKKFYNLLNK